MGSIIRQLVATFFQFILLRWSLSIHLCKIRIGAYDFDKYYDYKRPCTVLQSLLICNLTDDKGHLK